MDKTYLELNEGFNRGCMLANEHTTDILLTLSKCATLSDEGEGASVWA